MQFVLLTKKTIPRRAKYISFYLLSATDPPIRTVKTILVAMAQRKTPLPHTIQAQNHYTALSWISENWFISLVLGRQALKNEIFKLVASKIALAGIPGVAWGENRFRDPLA